MRRYQLGAHTKTDWKVPLIWIPKYRKRVLTGQVSVRVREVVRQMALEHEREISTGKVASDHVPMCIQSQPHQDSSKLVQGLTGLSSRLRLPEFAPLKKHFWGRHVWARGDLAGRAGNLTDEMIQQYIESQEGEPVVEDSRFTIDP